ncbi:MAG: peptidase S8 [Thermoleophilaceae bacterium]
MKKLAVVALAVVAAIPTASAQALPHSSAQGLSHRDACGLPAADAARCHAKVVTDSNGRTFNGAPNATTGNPAGWHSADLQNAYKLDVTGGAGRTIAIVDAYHAPNAASDLVVYRSTMNLPACDAGTCFQQVNQSGATSPLPAADTGWAEEISLDLDMASSACPNCNILLVEANSNSFADLMAAVNRAWLMGANAVSNSYGGREFFSETSYDSYFDHPGTAFTVSSGDSGYGTEYPAASRFVTATGGTSLSTTTANSRGWTESAWSGAGSGCSSYESKPAWQHDTKCSRRTIADVSSVSNPNTGVSVYDTFNDPGWMVFGGTSAAAPFIGGVYALGAKPANATSDYGSSWPYANTGSLFDVTSGKNGSCRKSPYLCTAGAGYDGPTGLGTPNGAGAF